MIGKVTGKRGEKMEAKKTMTLKFKENEKGRSCMFLDGKELHHVKEYKIESSTFAGRAELSIKILVQFPVNQENTS